MAAASLNDTQGIVALAALAVAVLALVACVALMRSMRRMRSAQKVVLGDGSQRDVIAHGASLQFAPESYQP